MLRTDNLSPQPRVGAATRSRRSGALLKPRARARDEAVEIQEKRFGYFPQRFLWRGRSHIVQAVEQCWTRTGRDAQLCFRVRCQEGVFKLTQHVKGNIWRVSVIE